MTSTELKAKALAAEKFFPPAQDDPSSQETSTPPPADVGKTIKREEPKKTRLSKA